MFLRAVAVSVRCFWLCLTRFCCALQHSLLCVSVLVVVCIGYVDSWLCGKRNSQEEGDNRLSLPLQASRCFFWLKLCRHRRHGA
jgi:hypothetical protein